LRALFVPSSPVDQERLAQAVAPAGWCTRAEWSGTVAEADVITNLDFSARISTDDSSGTSSSTTATSKPSARGIPNARFPHGHAWLTDQIHARGFKAGLWVAPFGVAEASGVPTAQPDWLLRDATGPVVCETREAWGGKIYALDGAHPKCSSGCSIWPAASCENGGYDYLRVDRLRWATLGTAHYGG